MKIDEIKKKMVDQGCTIIDEKPFSIVTKCAGGNIFVVKNPESRMKLFINSPSLREISGIVGNIPGLNPKEISIGSFSKQGEWSRMIKLDNLDKVEYTFLERELGEYDDETIKSSMKRIKRANSISYAEPREVIEPFKILRGEVEKISSILSTKIEDEIASKVGDNVVCASNPFFQKSWNQIESEKYHFSISVNCVIPPLLPKVSKALETVGGWRTMSESDSLFIKSIVSPSKDSFLTGIKIKSIYGDNQYEFELMDENESKKDDFIKNFEIISNSNDETFSEEAVNVDKIIPEELKE